MISIKFCASVINQEVMQTAQGGNCGNCFLFRCLFPLETPSIDQDVKRAFDVYPQLWVKIVTITYFIDCPRDRARHECSVHVCIVSKQAKSLGKETGAIHHYPDGRNFKG